MNIGHGKCRQLGVGGSLAFIVRDAGISKIIDSTIYILNINARPQFEVSVIIGGVPIAEHPCAIIVDEIIFINFDHRLDIEMCVVGQILHHCQHLVIPFQVINVQRQRFTNGIFIPKIFLRQRLVDHDG